MKKLLVLIAVLAIAGTAFAADLNDGLTKQVYAQSKGRSVVSDSSVLLQAWYTGTGTGTIGVSGNTSVNLYENGVLTAADVATYTTVETLANQIDATANWNAVVGPDAYKSHASTNLLTITTAAAGSTKESPTNVLMDCSTPDELMCGVQATENKINRIKSITHRVPGTGIVTLRVYDENTLVWQKSISADAYTQSASPNASPNTVTFTNTGDKGLSGGMGNSLVARVSRTSIGVTDETGITAANLAIVYDQF